jgi:hypothetical protein
LCKESSVPVVRSKTRRTAALLIASATVLFTAACGGADEQSATGDTSGANSAFTAYLDCMKENGVTITMPAGGPGGGARPSGAPDGVRPSGMPNGMRPSGVPGGDGQPGDGQPGDGQPGDGQPGDGQPRPEGSGGPRGSGGFPGGGGLGKPEGVDDATWEKAQTACAAVRPSMGAGRGNRGGGNGANAAYTNCLKENGVTDTANLDTTDATVQKAVETCQVLKPTASATS